MIDKLFDVMNSRRVLAKGFKSPMTAKNWSEKEEFLMKAREYLLSLVMKDNSPVHTSKR